MRRPDDRGPRRRHVRTLGLFLSLSLLTAATQARGPRPASLPALGFVESSRAGAGFEFHGWSWRVSFEAGGLVFAPTAGPGGPTLRRSFLGGRESAAPVVDRALPGVWNRLVGPPETWRTCRSHWNRLKYTGLYPEVDLVFETDGRELKGTFLVAPGADPRAIRIRHEGPHEARIDVDGSLVIETPSGTLREKAPFAFQVLDGRRVEVACRYSLGIHGDVSFELGRHDPARPLVIDPELAYSTLIEGHAWDGASEIRVVGGGQVVVGGVTRSSDFPTTPGAIDATNEGTQLVDAWVAGLDASGSELRFCTLLGGEDTESLAGLEVGDDGVIYVAGTTDSPNFPTTPGAFGTPSQRDTVFVAALSPNGDALLFSSLFGGVSDDSAEGLALHEGWLYLAGRTSSGDFPTTPGVHDRVVLPNTTDAFVSVLSRDGTELLQSTVVGERGGVKTADLAVVADGSVVVAGNLNPDETAPFPTTPGAFQEAVAPESMGAGFVFRLSPDFSRLVSSTFVAGSTWDTVHAAHVDRWGNAYITGETDSPDFPTTPGAFDEVHGGGTEIFVTKVSPDARSLIYSTFLGDAAFGEGLGITLDSAGVAHVVGRTLPAGFPTTPDAFDRVGGDRADAFFTSIGPAGDSLIYSTLLGGLDSDEAYAVTFDQRGGVFLVGDTESLDFPLTPGAWDDELTPATSAAAFISKFQLECPPEPPAPGGAALRVSRPGGGSDDIELDWSADDAQPRPFDEHYHLLSGDDPRVLSLIPDTEPWLDLTSVQVVEPSAVLPFVTFFRVDVANRCEQAAPLWR